MEELRISGAFVFTPRILPDERGVFLEWFRSDDFGAAAGHSLNIAQANISVSRRGVLRGVHFAAVPPGQAKYVTCVHGAALDVIVDLRVGSPTFGSVEAVVLDDRQRRAVYLAEGLGHAFMALTDHTAVAYLCSQPYMPGREYGVNPLDPELAMPWPAGIEPLLSKKDAKSPTLAEALRSGLLPSYDTCLDYVDSLRRT